MDLKAWRQLYGVSQIPMCLVQDNKVLLALPELAPPAFTPRFLELCQIDYRNYAQSHTGPLLIMLNPGYYLGIVQIDDRTFFILGPGVLAQFSWDELKPWVNAPLFEDNHSAMGRLLMGQKTTTAPQFFNTLSLALYLATGSAPDPNSFSLFDKGYLHYQDKPSLTKYMFDAKESEGFHTPYSWEIEMTHAVETGNPEQLKKQMLRQMIGRQGVLSTDADRQIRYMFVTAVAVFSRAALRGGLHYEKVYSLADIYCQRMDAMNNLGDIEQLLYQMLEHFCWEVAQLKLEQYSPLVRKCCTHIQQHSHDKITLKVLSDHCGISARRLSEKFKKETNCSVADYVHRIKMEEAESLLQDSDYSMGEISEYLGYANQSHSISVFRCFYGMTPMQYRNHRR